MIKIKLRSVLIGIFCLFLSEISLGQNQFTLSGYIKDQNDGEALIGATVFVNEISNGVISNVYGFYAISLPKGTYTITYQYMGYVDREEVIELHGDVRLDVELAMAKEELDEVVITGEAIDQNVESVEMSVAKLDIKTIEKIPAFAGEVDIIKSIQLLPGVSTVGEGASGFNVRGGGVGQNLVLLDEAPVYQSSHMFGFFSVFNPDAVKDVKLFKGGIPSRYGGRLSSILDIRMKEGNAKRVEVNGGVGTVFSRLAVEGPLKKDKSSFIIAARRSYADVVAKLVTDALQDGMGLYFYDLTAKTNFNINDKNRIYLSGYFGRDVFKFDKNQGFDWGNKTATFRWNHLYGSKLFSNYTLFYSNYDYGFEFGENAQDKFIWKSNIKTGNFKPEFTYFINSKNELTFGGEAILYRFEPANSESISGGISTNISVENRRAVETAVYIGNDQKMNENLTFQYGLRYSTFTYIGGSVYAYGDILPGIKKPLLSVSQKGDWEPIKSFGNIEPRASFRWKVSNTSSIKGSYNRMNQYIHLISNTTASIPIDIWQPSTNNIDPQQGNQVALGYFKNLKENAYETSAEVYYKWNENQIDYIDGADLFINPFLESQLLSGIGRAYGLEFYMAKKTGKLNGWVSYTLGKTEMKVDGINYGNDKENRTGNWYPTRFDQRHNLKIASFYDLNKRVSFSANFSYLSGTPTTFPTDRITIQDYVIPYIKGSLRNNVRIPDYHRLDLSVTINNVWRGKKGRKGSDYLVLSVYNLYGRKNPFSIYFSQGNDRQLSVDPVNTSATQLSIIGSVIPAISYNFKF